MAEDDAPPQGIPRPRPKLYALGSKANPGRPSGRGGGLGQMMAEVIKSTTYDATPSVHLPESVESDPAPPKGMPRPRLPLKGN
jgi:hypothetical protein